jgi:metallo-beta-lactamase class B
MTFRLSALVTMVAVFVASAGHAFAQQPSKRNYDAEIRVAVEAAKSAAGFEHLGTLARLCLQPRNRSDEATGDVAPDYMVDPAKVPPRHTWYTEPAKVFDNFYFVGGKVHSAWALTTREGIILFDTIYPYNSEEAIIGGMRKLGLDPNNIKYVLVSHSHGDHIGGAEMIQKRYSPRVVMSGADWDLLAKYPNRYKGMSPQKDITATDGMKITLGEETVTIWSTPGHTVGTISYTFSVLDRGRRVNVVHSGGTALVFESRFAEAGIKNLQTYIDSQRHLAAKAKETGATVLISNHSEFDMAYAKNNMLAGRGKGPHPYEIGADWVQRYFRVAENCTRAAQLGLEKQLAGSQ